MYSTLSIKWQANRLSDKLVKMEDLVRRQLWETDSTPRSCWGPEPLHTDAGLWSLLDVDKQQFADIILILTESMKYKATTDVPQTNSLHTRETHVTPQTLRRRWKHPRVWLRAHGNKSDAERAARVRDGLKANIIKYRQNQYSFYSSIRGVRLICLLSAVHTP